MPPPLSCRARSCVWWGTRSRRSGPFTRTAPSLLRSPGPVLPHRDSREDVAEVARAFFRPESAADLAAYDHLAQVPGPAQDVGPAPPPQLCCSRPLQALTPLNPGGTSSRAPRSAGKHRTRGLPPFSPGRRADKTLATGTTWFAGSENPRLACGATAEFRRAGGRALGGRGSARADFCPPPALAPPERHRAAGSANI